MPTNKNKENKPPRGHIPTPIPRPPPNSYRPPLKNNTAKLNNAIERIRQITIEVIARNPANPPRGRRRGQAS
jgi:hypothetical protein